MNVMTSPVLCNGLEVRPCRTLRFSFGGDT